MLRRISHGKPLRDDLPGPTIFGAEDGGLGYNDLLESPTTRVQITCPTYIFQAPALAELFWGVGATTPIATVPVAEGTASVRFEVSGQAIAGSKFPGDDDRYTGDGTFGVWYRYTYTDGADRSLPTPVVVKCTLPGGQDPVGDTRDINENLIPATITPSPIPDEPGITARVSVPSWRNISAGDVMTVYWSGKPFVCDAVDASLIPPTLTLSRQDLDDAGGAGHKLVQYEIYDLVRNWSKYSPVATVDVYIVPPPEPWVDDTVDDAGALLRLSDLVGEVVRIHVENHGATAGSRIELAWAPGAGEPWHAELPVRRTNEPLTFEMPVVEANRRVGNVVVSYTIRSDDSDDLPSLPRRLYVEPVSGLLPVEIIGAEDGIIRLADVPADGATMRAGHQPLIPAGSTLTFSWEGVDTAGDPIQGWVTAEDDGSSPTLAKLPRSVLQRVAGKVAVRYVADTGGIEEHLESPWITFQVAGAAIWPVPTVAETGGTDTLLPVAARDGATVLIDADLVATDQVAVSFGRYTAAAVNGGRPLRVTIPISAVAEHLGETISVLYTVTRNGVPGTSSPMTLHVGTFLDQDAQLPTPRIDRADEITGVLDLGTFQGDPVALVDPWLLMAVGQTVWLRVDGVRQDGSTDTLHLYNEIPVDARMLATGLEAPIDRRRLETWTNASDIVVSCKVNFRRGGEAGAIQLKPRTYRLRISAPPVQGRAFEVEEFEDPATTVNNGDVYRLRFATLRPLGGRIQMASTNLPPYLEGRHPFLYETVSSVTATLRFDHPAQVVTLGVRPRNSSYLASVTARDLDGMELWHTNVTSPEVVRFPPRGTPATSPIASIEVQSQASQYVDFDKLFVETGSPWDIKTPPVRETFDDLPLGSHGDHYEFDRWYINANGGLVEIETAPGGMFRQALAIHMDPAAGRIHQLTPQFAVCPRIGVALTMRSSATTAHQVTVAIVYVNREDHVLRTVTRSVSLSSAAQYVLFNAVGDLARDTEYVSHFRITHAGSLAATVFYDDIVFD
jgi:hypothetical protein